MTNTNKNTHRDFPCLSLASCPCGFTMLELIIVIVILGVLGSMGAEFISQAFKGFKETGNRIEMYEEGRLALTRLERELQGAVPNAVDVSSVESGNSNAISFGVINESAMAGVSGRYEEEHPSGQTTLKDISGMLAAQAIVSIYNTSWDAFATAAGNSLYRVTSVDGTTRVMTLNRAIDRVSPYQRYFVVRPQAVRFVVSGGRIFRETATVNPGGALGAFAGRFPLVDHVVPSDPNGYFFYFPGTSTRSSIVVVHFAIDRDGEVVNFHKEIKIRNVP
ncbi:MAG: hypothetical protein A2512_02015 [Deltaproteobacteria bacterium RIFOXYD12_FULL_56_24]|nr:MAG: hypothetical protein A2512_02015 [Deltaproteobacteria bacterium RIFOXYD12_FULL_56_24]